MLLRGAMRIGLGNTRKLLRCTASSAACIGLVTTTNYLRRTTGGAASNGRAQ
jgi:hypothetical protein